MSDFSPGRVVQRKGFTLIELLVVIAIIAILAVVVVLTLNPAQLLAQSRDANRVSDMATLSSALNLYSTDQAGTSGFSLGNASNTAISIYDQNASSTCGSLGLPVWNTGSGQAWQCATSGTYRNASSTGWIPVNFQNISAGVPFSSLPVDPVNQTSSGLFYSYNTNGSQFAVIANLESSKYKQNYGNSLQTNYFPEVISGGTPSVSALYSPTGLVGYWSFNEGSGSSTIDQSGNNNSGLWSGSTTGGSYYTAGKVGSYAGNFDGTDNCISLPLAMPTSSNLTVSAWVNMVTSSLDGAWGRRIVERSDGTNYYAMTMNTNNTLAYSFRTNSTNSVTALTPGQWYLITLTVQGTSTILYVNGAFDSSLTLSSPLAVASGVPYVGCYAGNGHWSGQLDDMRIYSRALSAAEVQAIYNSEK